MVRATKKAAKPPRKPVIKESVPVPVSGKTIKVGGAVKQLNARRDIPDIRDRMYEPPLIELRPRLYPAGNFLSPILDQGDEGSCTGFSLAATVNLLLNQRLSAAGLPLRAGGELVSPRMIYEMAKVHDEWAGEGYEGSSLRGALKGFFHNGICTLNEAPYVPGEKNGRLTVPRAKDARNIGLGAYYRLRPQMIDYHAAISQAGTVYVSAQVHEGWQQPQDGRIVPSNRPIGGHAFAIVGYDDEGFLVQNSWGPNWGGFSGWGGIAHWRYDDWAKNVSDAWVLRLAVPTPKAFDLTVISVDADSATRVHVVKTPDPRREEILGHFAHIDDGKFVETGNYGTSLANIQSTAEFLTADGRGERKYKHLAFYCHGGLNDAAAAARRIAVSKEGYKRNGIYPFHFMWETGFAEELLDILGIKFAASAERVGGVRDVLDWMIEKTSGPIGLRFWREMKLDAARAFAAANAAGLATMKTLLTANAALPEPRPVHFIGHSAGSILIAELLAQLGRIGDGRQKIASVSLMAPACTVDVYKNAYVPALRGANPVVRKLRQYNLTDRREQDDSLLGVYQKSLLYIVSNAFEERKEMPLLGMEKFSGTTPLAGDHVIYYAGRDTARTDSFSHGGFDNDVKTMNDILTTILGKKPTDELAFKEAELGE
jgi:hypothetical protein